MASTRVLQMRFSARDGLIQVQAAMRPTECKPSTALSRLASPILIGQVPLTRLNRNYELLPEFRGYPATRRCSCRTGSAATTTACRILVANLALLHQRRRGIALAHRAVNAMRGTLGRTVNHVRLARPGRTRMRAVPFHVRPAHVANTPQSMRQRAAQHAQTVRQAQRRSAMGRHFACAIGATQGKMVNCVSFAQSGSSSRHMAMQAARCAGQTRTHMKKAQNLTPTARAVQQIHFLLRVLSPAQSQTVRVTLDIVVQMAAHAKRVRWDFTRISMVLPCAFLVLPTMAGLTLPAHPARCALRIRPLLKALPASKTVLVIWDFLVPTM